MKLSTRLIIAMLSLAALATIATSWIMGRAFEGAMLPLETDRHVQRARARVAPLVDAAEQAIGDARILAEAPSLAGYRRALAAGGIDPQTGRSAEQWRTEVTQLFVSFATARPEYVQLRLIDGHGDCPELVRVDRMNQTGVVAVIPDAELQSKGDRPYVQNALNLPHLGVYISPIELNRERGQIDVPHLPVLRVSTALRSPNGDVDSLVVVNQDMRDSLSAFRRYTEVGERPMLVDSDGSFLVHPDSRREFAFEYGKPYRLGEEFAALADVLSSPTLGVRNLAGGDGTNFTVAIVPVRLAENRHLVAVDAIPFAVLRNGIADAWRAAMAGGIAMLIAAAILAAILSRSLAGPLARMTAAVESFGAKGHRPVPVDAAGEIGVLARSFARMELEVSEKNARLEQQAERDGLMRAFVESAEDAIITVSNEGHVTTWNPGAAQLLGFAEHEAIGADIAAILSGESGAEIAKVLQRVRTGERVPRFELERPTNAGSTTTISVITAPVYAPSGSVIGASLILRDIGEAKLAAERFRLAIESSPSGVVMADKNGSIVLVNAETVRMFGYEREELLGASVDMLVPERFRRGHPGHRHAYHQEPTSRSMGLGRDLYARRKDGTEFPVEIGLNPIRGSQGTLVMSVIVDITARKAAEDAIARHTVELQRSNAELEQFAYVASHDLQEPLRMVVSYSELLAQRYEGKLDERADKYIRYMVEGGKRMQQLVSDLLAYSRVGTQGKPLLPTDSAEVVHSVLQSLRRAMQDAGARVNVPDELPLVLADETQLRQLFQNLIGNAIKFRSDAPPVVDIAVTRMGDRWQFSVRDNGIGMDPRHSTRVFQMFQRLHERGKYDGSGIGLSIAKRIVERHGGRIWFESEIGKGATFYFTVADGRSTTPTGQHVEPPSGSSQHT